jgi:hypothetical protein
MTCTSRFDCELRVAALGGDVRLVVPLVNLELFLLQVEFAASANLKKEKEIKIILAFGEKNYLLEKTNSELID